MTSAQRLISFSINGVTSSVCYIITRAIHILEALDCFVALLLAMTTNQYYALTNSITAAANASGSSWGRLCPACGMT
jgi:hypothetical protein